MRTRMNRSTAEAYVGKAQASTIGQPINLQVELDGDRQRI
jgi:hypothetical protein